MLNASTTSSTRMSWAKRVMPSPLHGPVSTEVASAISRRRLAPSGSWPSFEPAPPSFRGLRLAGATAIDCQNCPSSLLATASRTLPRQRRSASSSSWVSVTAKLGRSPSVAARPGGPSSIRPVRSSASSTPTTICEGSMAMDCSVHPDVTVLPSSMGTNRLWIRASCPPGMTGAACEGRGHRATNSRVSSATAPAIRCGHEPAAGSSSRAETRDRIDGTIAARFHGHGANSPPIPRKRTSHAHCASGQPASETGISVHIGGRGGAGSGGGTGDRMRNGCMLAGYRRYRTRWRERR